jgi:hypothetical protein
VSVAPSKVSVAPSKVSVAPSKVSVAPSKVSVAPSKVSVAPSKASHSQSIVDKDDVVSFKESSYLKEDERSNISVSLSEITLNKPEDAVNSWYHKELNALETKFEEQKLRPEQFKRKRALLRVEYWTRLDGIRNNATPTVIGS